MFGIYWVGSRNRIFIIFILTHTEVTKRHHITFTSRFSLVGTILAVFFVGSHFSRKQTTIIKTDCLPLGKNSADSSKDLPFPSGSSILELKSLSAAQPKDVLLQAQYPDVLDTTLEQIFGQQESIAESNSEILPFETTILQHDKLSLEAWDHPCIYSPKIAFLQDLDSHVDSSWEQSVSYLLQTCSFTNCCLLCCRTKI